MKLFTRFVARIFEYLYWREERAQHPLASGKMLASGRIKRTRFGKTPDAPLNRVEGTVLFLAERLLQKLRLCALCHRGDEQEYIMQYSDGYEVHVDCGAEHNDAMRVDPTTPYIGESDEAYEERMRREFPEL